MSAALGSALNRKGLFWPSSDSPQTVQYSSGAFRDDGDAVVLAVTEFGCGHVAAVATSPSGSLLGCVCADECHG